MGWSDEMKFNLLTLYVLIIYNLFVQAFGYCILHQSHFFYFCIILNPVTVYSILT